MSAYDDAILAQSSLQAYWKLDETVGATTVADSKNSNTGTVNGGCTLGTALLSALGTGCAFDGSTGYISIPTSATVSPTSAITVEFWLNPGTLTGATNRHIVCKPANNTNSGPFADYTIYFDNSASPTWSITFGLNLAGSFNSLQTHVLLNTGMVNHLVGTYDGSTMKVYLNGLQIATASHSGSIGASGQSLYIGQFEASAPQHVIGTETKVAIYNTALSSSDILNHYTLGITGSIVVDGTATAAPLGGNPATITLSTAQANDIIVVCVWNVSSSSQTVSSISGGSLTWTKRAGVNRNVSSIFNDLEIWWALAPTALSAVTITVTLTGTPTYWGLIGFGVAGCNTTSPWDSNGSLTASVTTTAGGSAPTISGISTSNLTDLLIVCYADYNGSSAASKVPSGFISIGTAVQFGGPASSEIGVGVNFVTSVQSSITETWGLGQGIGAIMVVDALQAPSTGVGSGAMLTMMD